MLDLLLRVCFPSAAALCVVTVWFMFFGSVQLRGRWCMYRTYFGGCTLKHLP
jgi:hypothetical protein